MPLNNIKHKPGTSHAPWNNGLVEGMNRSLQEYFFTNRNQSENPQKLLTNNHTLSLHRHHPKKTRQYLQLPKTPKHLHEFLSKITHTLLKNDTLAYLNH